MNKTYPHTNEVFDIVTKTTNLGITCRTVSDETLHDRNITVGDRPVINFASCSYLGLEFDSRLKNATIEATQKYGTQFSTSRSYLSVTPYKELEELLSQLFGYPTIAAPSTTMAHFACIPTLVGRKDLIIIDQQAHSSIQNAVKLAVANGTEFQVVRHNRMDYLEQMLKKYNGQYEKIWYMADGIYSMYGDVAPLEDLEYLLNKYPFFHLYIDDAHGMSWMGKNGVGYVLNEMDLHPQMIMLTSLNKSFSAAGGAIVCPNKEVERSIRYCGPTLMFSGPIQPPMLGAAIASAKIHMSDEINEMQNELQDNMRFCLDLVNEYNLPLLSKGSSPIFFIGIGQFEHGQHIVKILQEKGFFTSLGGYPSVPINRTGVRITINRNHKKADIYRLIATLSNELHLLLMQQGFDVTHLYKKLKLQPKVKV